MLANSSTSALLEVGICIGQILAHRPSEAAKNLCKEGDREMPVEVALSIAFGILYLVGVISLSHLDADLFDDGNP